MNELSPSGRALLDAARGTRPGGADRARIRSKLDARLALGAAAVGTAAASAVASTASAQAASGAVASAASVAPAAASTVTAASTVAATKVGVFGLLSKVGVAVLVLGAAGAGLRAWVAPSTPTPAPSALVARPLDERAGVEADSAEGTRATELPSEVDSTAPSATAVPDAAPIETATPDAPAQRSPLPSPQRPPAGGRDATSIAAEVALLRSAQSALKDGDGEASLRAIDSLTAKHPDGAMQEDGQAARVLALCSLGRVDEARAAASSFLAKFPGSVHAAQVRGSCAGR